jgi:hypothetical protein
MKKHVHEKSTRKYEITQKILIYCPEKNLGRQAYSSSLYTPMLYVNHFTSFQFTPVHFHFTSLHIIFIALLRLPGFYFRNPLPKCMRFNGGSPYRPFR